MTPVVFVAPFFAETTLRFVDAAARLPGVRLGLVSQDPPEGLPPGLRHRLATHCRVRDGLDPGSLARAVAAAANELGGCSRLVGALEQLQVPLALVREQLGIPGMDVSTANNFRDKHRMKAAFRAGGVPCARSGLATGPDEARRVAGEIGFPLVVKPPAGAGARNTMRVNDERELLEACAALRPDPERPLLLEEFIVGEEHSFDTVSVGGRHVWHSLTHYSPGPLEVMEQPWIQWTVLLPREVDHPQYDDIRAAAFRALDALGMRTGLSHLEWFRRPDGTVAVSEVAARPPGAQFTTLISWAHEIDFYAAWARLMIDERFDPPPRRYAAGIAFLRGQGRGRVRAIHGLERAQRELGELVAEVRLPQPGQLPASSYEGEGWVVLRHRDTAAVREGLRRLVTTIRVELG